MPWADRFWNKNSYLKANDVVADTRLCDGEGEREASVQEDVGYLECERSRGQYPGKTITLC